ncbi:SDR family oxidoreductase [Geitlerinema sp. PCC 9228]|jgi:NAD(P)-dependent dehydrogenase (short-subunit alcohol dehydrogenase family)|uniref:SDR family oxidoreductase n=1 Tax=Geitlerinema sp. PCC 9228 TaxID=111611 RepID=UPI0008F9BD3A|nr:SDR family oxidoreductase [Geitlerinema sp. PCC 9228]
MQGKVAIVVGATGGIGSSVSRKLADAGANVVLSARNNNKLDELASEIPNSLPVAADITDPQQVESMVQKAAEQFGQIDILVNAAGAGILKQWVKLTPEDLDAMLDVNLKGSFYTSQAAAKVMRGRKSGHICNITGILGKHSMAMGSAYCASKFGAVGFSKCMAEELRRFGIKFTLFYFGGVDSPFWDNVGLKVDRSQMLSTETAANAIMYALSAEPQAVPMEINIQPDSHLFF